MKKFYSCFLFLIFVAASQLKAQEREKNSNDYLNALNDLRFEQNVGQIKHDGTDAFASEVQFMLKNGNHKIFLMNNGLSHQFEQLIYPEGYDPMERDPAKMEAQEALRAQIQFKTYRMDMQLLGANAHPKITKEGKSAYPKRYYKGQSFTAWSWEKVTYHDVYPGIDWVLYTRGNEMKYDFVVHPGADPSMIQLKMTDAEEASIQNDGSFRWSSPMGWVNEDKPLSLQDGQEVESRYKYKDGVLQFELGAYDRNRVLCIDPTLQWGTYYGGSGADYVNGLATDNSGNVYITGYTNSTASISSVGSYQSTNGGGTSDAFIAKFNSNGSMLWGTYYGGSGGDVATGLTTDNSGNVYMTGYTSSTDSIATAGSHQSTIGGSYDAFIAKFDSSGSMQWGTYYGSSGNDYANGIAAADSGHVYISGYTLSLNSIATAGTHQSTLGGNADGFIAKFDSSGTRLWGTYYGGSGADYVNGIATADSGNVYIAGYTQSTASIATAGSYQSTYGGGSHDGFIAKFNSSGSMQWGTYYGPSGREYVNGLATADSGHVYITGYTNSQDSIATAGSHQSTYGGGSNDAFIAKFNSSGSMQWGTYYGGTGDDQAIRIATADSGHVYITGFTFSSASIATAGSHQSTKGAGFDAFIAKFNSSGTRLWGTYYGGNSNDEARGIATADSGHVYITVYTTSSDLIATAGSHQSTYGGSGDAFIAKFIPLLPAPEITMDPLNHTKCEGDTAYFACSVTGTFDSLQWQQYSNSWSRVKGGLDTFYRIDSTTAVMNGDSIRVIAYGPGGNDTSGTALIQFRGLRPTVTKAITQPSSGQANGSIDLNVSGYGSYLRYSRWSAKTGRNYPDGADFDLSNVANGTYYLMLITKEGCIYYEGPFVLGTAP